MRYAASLSGGGTLAVMSYDLTNVMSEFCFYSFC